MQSHAQNSDEKTLSSMGKVYNQLHDAWSKWFDIGEQTKDEEGQAPLLLAVGAGDHHAVGSLLRLYELEPKKQTHHFYAKDSKGHDALARAATLPVPLTQDDKKKLGFEQSAEYESLLLGYYFERGAHEEEGLPYNERKLENEGHAECIRLLLSYHFERGVHEKDGLPYCNDRNRYEGLLDLAISAENIYFLNEFVRKEQEVQPVLSSNILSNGC